MPLNAENENCRKLDSLKSPSFFHLMYADELGEGFVGPRLPD